jgi:hypothetical protein
MDVTVIQEAANAVWSLVGTSAAERLGEAATEEAFGVLERIRSQRRERGIDEDPASQAEVVEELQRLPDADRAMNLVVNTFNKRVDARKANFGFEITG